MLTSALQKDERRRGEAMARIMNALEPSNGSLYASLGKARAALAMMLDGYRQRGWKVEAHSDDPERWIVTDDSGQLIGDYYVEE
jgi:hypothetical protein